MCVRLTADPTAVVTFASVGRAASGKFGAYIVDICIVITQVSVSRCNGVCGTRINQSSPAMAGQTGFCTSYVIFIGESLADALSLQAGILPSWGRQQYGSHTHRHTDSGNGHVDNFGCVFVSGTLL